MQSFERLLQINLKLYTQLPIAGHWIHKQLQTEVAACVSPSDFQRFLHSFRVWTIDPSEREWKVARLELFNPTSPTAIPLYACLRTHMDLQHSYTAGLLQSTDWLTENLIYALFIRTAQRLNTEGHRSESRWVLDFARDLRPDIISDRYAFQFRHGRISERQPGVFHTAQLDGVRGGDVHSGITHNETARLHRSMWRSEQAAKPDKAGEIEYDRLYNEWKS
jgi:hypothetical protein